MRPAEPTPPTAHTAGGSAAKRPALRDTPIGVLRARLLAADALTDDGLLAALDRDPRRGARELARVLARRRDRNRAERARLDGLWSRERELRPDGATCVAGVDEVGMGPLAGPVVAAAVILFEGAHLPGLRDSKRLSAAARERLDEQIRACARAVAVGVVERREIDRVNIYQSGLLAMRKSVEGLRPRADAVLVDARHIPKLAVPQRAVVGGDDCVASIAAASIVAKVYRDALMDRLDRRYPGYGFAHNRGYGTAEHLRALLRLGPSPEHRRSFAPVASASERA